MLVCRQLAEDMDRSEELDECLGDYAFNESG
jgi:hypothetical protein